MLRNVPDKSENLNKNSNLVVQKSLKLYKICLGPAWELFCPATRTYFLLGNFPVAL